MRKQMPGFLAMTIVSLVLLSACQPEEEQHDIADLTDFATRYAAAWSGNDPVAFASFYAENGSFRINDGEPSVGRDAIAETARGFMASFPDMVVRLVELREANDHIEFHWHWTGTNTGPGGTGNAVDLRGYEVWTLNEDGLILESQGNMDDAEYQRQLSADTAAVDWASDACSTRAILTSADVTVSDGSAFKTESFFHSVQANAIRHISEDDRIIAVEGPFGWVRSGDSSQPGTDFHKLFALGHQFHAVLLQFDEIVTDMWLTERIDFQGQVHRARSGNYPYGGVVHLVNAADQQHPAGLLFEFPESPAISAVFSDWREHGDIELPFRVEIDDGERTFEYRYSSVDTQPRSPLWFFEEVSAPAIDEVQVYRLHRKLLAAHCLGDADLLAELSVNDVVSANRGELRRIANDAMRDRFTALFESLDYTAYHDIVLPIVEIAESSDLGWIGVEVRAVGSVKESGAPFDDQWAWLMVVRKVDGRWLHAGNASNTAH